MMKTIRMSVWLSVLALALLPAKVAAINVHSFDLALFEQFVTMRVGAGEPVYWYCVGELYSYPAGKLLAKVEGIDTARLFKAESRAGSATQISRKIFIYRDPASGAVMGSFDERPVTHIEYPYQLIRYELRGGEVVSFVEQGSGARLQKIGPVHGMSARRMGGLLIFSAPLFLNFETPRGQYEAYENYDFLVQPASGGAPRYQLTWNRFGDLPPFMGAGKSVMQLVSHRLDSYADLPGSIREYLEKEAPLWKQPPKDLDEIRRLQQAPNPAQNRRDEELERLAEWMTGSFDTFDQVAQDEGANAAYKHVRVTLNIVPVTIAGMSERGRTLYIEQAMADAPDKPYRQGVYFLTRDERGAIVNRNFRLSNPEEFIGGWKDPAKLKALTQERLLPIAGCDITLTRMDERRYSAIVGLHGSCKSTIRGATHMVSQGEITPDYQITLDQGFDNAGNHKWGPPPGVIGHIFKKRSALTADLKLMMEMFEGEFDNYAQAWEDKERKAEYPHEHIHSIFHRVNLPAVGEHVFYVKQYTDGDPAKIYRQRLYNFTLDEKEQAIRLDIYTFPDERAVTDAHLDPSKLAGLTKDRLRATPGCEVYWRRRGEEFHGYMKPTCRVNSQRLGKTIIITDDLKLNRDEIWINDQAKDEAGNYVFGNKSGVHHKLRRARWFEGWAVLRVAETGDDKKDYEALRGLRLHDQGQMLPLVKANGEQTSYSLQLSHLTEQSSKTPVMVFKLFEEGKSQAIAYTWTQPGAARVGINLRWFQSGFTLKR
jgi:hypothetical protein